MRPLLQLSAALLLAAFPARAAAPLVIHEWGTLTSLEDESGQPIPGINADDEPVPSFVHRISHGLLLPPQHIDRLQSRPPHPP